MRRRHFRPLGKLRDKLAIFADGWAEVFLLVRLLGFVQQRRRFAILFLLHLFGSRRRRWGRGGNWRRRRRGACRRRGGCRLKWSCGGWSPRRLSSGRGRRGRRPPRPRG